MPAFFHPLPPVWLVESIGMQSYVGWRLQGKDKTVISGNEAALVPESKCANISNSTRPCVYVCVCVCSCDYLCVTESEGYQRGQTEVIVLTVFFPRLHSDRITAIITQQMALLFLESASSVLSTLN